MSSRFSKAVYVIFTVLSIIAGLAIAGFFGWLGYNIYLYLGGAV